jgi:hypothetical protein
MFPQEAAQGKRRLSRFSRDGDVRDGTGKGQENFILPQNPLDFPRGAY